VGNFPLILLVQQNSRQAMTGYVINIYDGCDISSISLVVCRTTCSCQQLAGLYLQVLADWLHEEGAEPAAAAAVSVARRPLAVTCQSPGDAPPSCAALSVHQQIIDISDGLTYQCPQCNMLTSIIDHHYSQLLLVSVLLLTIILTIVLTNKYTTNYESRLPKYHPFSKI